MRNATDTLPELGVLVNDLLVDNRKWYGIMAQPKQEYAQRVLTELNRMLMSSKGALPLDREGPFLYARGPYPRRLVSRIEQYFSRHKDYFAQEPVIAFGTEDDILGPGWNRIAAHHKGYKH